MSERHQRTPGEVEAFDVGYWTGATVGFGFAFVMAAVFADRSAIVLGLPAVGCCIGAYTTRRRAR